MTDEIALLVDQIQTALHGGLRIHDGVPYIHGKKAVWDDEEPLLDCFSHWQCPHCGSALAAEKLICLNGCHFTAPQHQKFQNEIAHYTWQVKMREMHYDSTIGDIHQRVVMNYYPREEFIKGGYFIVDVERPEHFSIEESQAYTVTLRVLLSQHNWEGYVALGFYNSKSLAFFEKEEDAIFFKLQLED